ncbi:head GIN domain-containing protein [Pedobacter sp. MW01-1-1]|uniref:head GIN domain-containing protein n=1 Tax=Pedobacter sp. MW01-1-1 TaxID=3383027 RepID=UPI003FEE603F
MKKFLSVALTAITIVSSSISHATNPIRPNAFVKTINSDERDVKNFKGVAAGGPIKVVITLGDTESCRFEGDAEAISTLITQVKSNILIIRPENSWTSWAKKYEGKKITAYITAKTITSLTMSGNGSMTVDGSVDVDDLSVTLSGSGNLWVNTHVNDFNGVLSGSGKLSINGKADNATIVLSGSAKFGGSNFEVEKLSATLSGSGTVNIKASQHIKAFITGSANINYSGNAEVDKTVLGSGSVRKV